MDKTNTCTCRKKIKQNHKWTLLKHSIPLIACIQRFSGNNWSTCCIIKYLNIESNAKQNLHMLQIECFILQYELLTLYGVSCHYCILKTISSQPGYLKLSNLFKPTLGDWVGVGISKGNLPRGKLGSALRGITKHQQANKHNKTYLSDWSLSALDPAESSSSVILLLVGS